MIKGSKVMRRYTLFTNIGGVMKSNKDNLNTLLLDKSMQGLTFPDLTGSSAI